VSRAERYTRLPMKHAALLLSLALLASAASAQEENAPAKQPAAAEETEKKDDGPAPLAIGKDLASARAQARTEKKPLLVLAGPAWYAHPAVKQLDETVIPSDAARKALGGFVIVRVDESEDRDVHVRHRLRDRGYPLAVVLSAEGGFLGSVSGLDEKTWVDKVAAVPERHARIQELLGALRDRPEHPATLLALAKLRLETDEPDRAEALLERLELADRYHRSGLLAETRYLRLRIAAVNAFVARRFTDVESLCLKWLRRFEDAEQRPEVLLLQANARFLAGDHERAKKVWNEIVEKHADTPAAAKAKAATEKL